MRKPDEVAFYAALRHMEVPSVTAVLDLINRSDMSGKRATRLLEKWTDRGWWEFGVSLYGGWFTKAAPEELSV